MVKGPSLSNPKLLADLVAFKQRFYPSTSARYDLAKPGSFRLIPDQRMIPALASDYRDMAVMMFGDVPRFDAIFTSLTALEADINKSRNRATLSDLLPGSRLPRFTPLSDYRFSEQIRNVAVRIAEEHIVVVLVGFFSVHGLNIAASELHHEFLRGHDHILTWSNGRFRAPCFERNSFPAGRITQSSSG
jgi:hypothetical protein